MDIKDASLYKRTQKKEYNIYFSVPAIGTKVHNILELADYVTDEKHPIVLTGTVGEEWVVTEESLLHTYTRVDGSSLTHEDVWEVRESGDRMEIRAIPGVTSYAVFVPVHLRPAVYTSWGTMLITNAAGVDHGEGDYILCAEKDGAPDLDDMRVVNGLVFENTYEPIK